MRTQAQSARGKVTATIGDQSVDITVTQTAGITLNPATLNVTASSTSQNFMLTSNVAWEATESEDWITSVTPATGTANPGTEQTLTINYTENLTADARTGTLTVTETGATDTGATGTTISATLMLTQAASTSAITLNQATFSVTAEAGSQDFMLTSSVAWEATESEDWITSVTPATGTASGTPQTVTINYTANPTANARTGTITVTETGATGSPTIVTLTLMQSETLLTLTNKSYNLPHIGVCKIHLK